MNPEGINGWFTIFVNGKTISFVKSLMIYNIEEH